MNTLDLREIRLLLVEGRSLARAFLSAAFEAEPDVVVVGAVDGAAAAARLVADIPTDIVLVDASLIVPAAEESLAATRRSAKLVVISEQGSLDALLQAVETGAHGFVSEDMSVAEVMAALRQVHAGGMHVPPALLRPLLDELLARSRRTRQAVELLGRLTRREREVLELLAEGCAHDEVAEILVISPQTARTHIQNVLGKLEVHSRVEAAALAMRYGLVGNRATTHR